MSLTKIVFLLLPLLLLGCSKKPNGSDSQGHVRPSSAVPFHIGAVQSPESAEINDIWGEAEALLKQGNFDKLEALAAEHRSSKASYADGMWKLAFVYNGTADIDSTDEPAWQARQKLLQNWVDAKPESITARVAMARFLTGYAWNARGSGYANTVSEASWQLFRERLNTAAKILQDAHQLKETCPIYWSSLLQVVLGLNASKQDYNDIFKQAIQAEPDYKYYYQTRATFLLPRWSGTEGEWVRDVTQSADRIGGEDGDMLYAQVVWSVHHYDASGNVFGENKQISWDRVDRGFAVILKHFPDTLAALNERAHLAALAGDKAKAREYFKATGGKVDFNVWYNAEEFTSAANWAFKN